MPVVVIGSPFEGEIGCRADTRTIGTAKARPFLGQRLNAWKKQEQEHKTKDRTPACPRDRFMMDLVAKNLDELLGQDVLAPADNTYVSFEHDTKPRDGKRTRSSLGIAFVHFAY